MKVTYPTYSELFEEEYQHLLAILAVIAAPILIANFASDFINTDKIYIDKGVFMLLLYVLEIGCITILILLYHKDILNNEGIKLDNEQLKQYLANADKQNSELSESKSKLERITVTANNKISECKRTISDLQKIVSEHEKTISEQKGKVLLYERNKKNLERIEEIKSELQASVSELQAIKSKNRSLQNTLNAMKKIV